MLRVGPDPLAQRMRIDAARTDPAPICCYKETLQSIAICKLGDPVRSTRHPAPVFDSTEVPPDVAPVLTALTAKL